MKHHPPEAPRRLPLKGRYLRPGKAGSAMPLALGRACFMRRGLRDNVADP
jgi:hypothetical protein